MPRRAQVVGLQVDDLANAGVQILRQLLGGMLAGEREEVDDDPLAAARRLHDPREVVLEIAAPVAGLQELRVTQDRGERIVQLVRDAGDDLSQARQPLRLREALLRAAQIGHVRPEEHPPGDGRP